MNSKHLAVQDFAPEWGPRRPGVYIQRQLDAVGRSQSDLAERMGISKKHLNQVIKGTASVSPDFALALERAIGIRAGVLLRLEADWQTYRIENESRADLARHVRWLANFPRETLLENRVVEPGDDELTMVDRVLRFFGVSNPPAFERVWLAPQASFKRSEAFAINPYCTALWLQLAARKAEQLSTAAPTYNVQLLRDAATQLPSLTTNSFPEAFQEAQRLLLSAGVILVFQPEVKETRLSGVSLWLPSDRPMIALTNRYKFSDSLWFSLAHEIGHVLLHLKRTTFLDSADELGNHIGSDAAAPHEAAANSFAERLFLGAADSRTLRQVETKPELIRLADALGVSVSVLAGQYGHLTGDYRKFARLRSTLSPKDAEALAA